MRVAFLMLAFVCILSPRVVGQARVIPVTAPTVVAFFPPVSKAELAKDVNTNEALEDFQRFAARARERLRAVGVDFQEVYARSFRLQLGKQVVTHRVGKIGVGYYLIAPGRKPHIELGVITDDDLLDLARSYFKQTNR